MADKIHLLKNNNNLKLSDVEWANKVYYYLLDDLKLRKKKAFRVIYYLQERFPVIPDNIEQCSNCGELYDSHSQGHHSELTGKFYCSESCEPAGLYEREQRYEKHQQKKLTKTTTNEQK